MGIPIRGDLSALERVFNASGFNNMPIGHSIVGSGDLIQLSKQEQALRKAGFEVGRYDVYPTVITTRLKDAFVHLFNLRIDGWWNLNLVPDVLTQEEYNQALGI